MVNSSESDRARLGLLVPYGLSRKSLGLDGSRALVDRIKRKPMHRKDLNAATTAVRGGEPQPAAELAGDSAPY